jgi:ATP-dependent Zn protease
MIDSKIHNIFNSCYKNTQSKLKKVKPLIEHLTNVLIAKQVLEYDEIVQEILDFTRLETPILSGPQKENVTELINLF